MKVFVYKNLKKKSWTGEEWVNCYSIKNCKTKKVEDWQPFVVLKDATFKVSEAGRQRVLREKRKNVHAGILGERKFGGWDPSSPFLDEDRVMYNPYKNETFVNSKGQEIISADLVILSPKGVFAYGQQHSKKNRKTSCVS